MQFVLFRLHGKVDTLGGAHLFAGTAECAVFDVDGCRLGVGNAEGNEGCLPAYQPILVLITHVYRTGLLAELAGSAVFHMHIARLLGDLRYEVVLRPFDNVGHLTLGEEGDVLVAGDLRHLGCGDAGGTVECGEHLAQQDHFAPQRTFFLHQQYPVAAIGKVERCFAPGDAASYH